jgi:hypothetical protein
MTTYATLSNRIRTANTREELSARETQITRHYHAGTITAREFSRLDGIMMDRAFFIDTLTENSPPCHITSPLHSAWLAKVAQLEAEGCDTSDAQSIADRSFILDNVSTNLNITAP